jgi:hypothetical protein
MVSRGNKAGRTDKVAPLREAATGGRKGAPGSGSRFRHPAQSSNLNFHDIFRIAPRPADNYPVIAR